MRMPISSVAIGRVGHSAGLVAATALAAGLLRAIVSKIFKDQFGDWVPVIGFAFFVAIAWTVFLCTVLLIQGRVVRHQRSQPQVPGNGSSVLALGKAVGLSAVLAVAMWFALYASDEVFFSRMLPWDLPLINLQHIGALVVSRFFPCRLEGSDFGCEIYKTLPAYFAVNAVVYLPFVIAFRSLSKGLNFESVRRGLRVSCRTVTVVGLSGLAAILVLQQFAWEAGWRNQRWFSATNYSIGVIVVIAGFLLVYLTLKSLSTGDEDFLPEMTWVACSLVAGRWLGSPFLP